MKRLEQKNLEKQFESLNIGDLICVEWNDASVGKSLSIGVCIDVPVRSWGIYVGLFGNKTKHVVVAQNSFRYADSLFDLDYTAIPLGWAASVSVLVKEHIPGEAALKLVNSFMRGGHRTLNRTRTFQRHMFQEKLSSYGRLN